MFELDGQIAVATGNVGPANDAAKVGLIGISKALAQQVAPRRPAINAVAPGFIAMADNRDHFVNCGLLMV